MKALQIFLTFLVFNHVFGYPLTIIDKPSAALACNEQESAEVSHKIPIIGSVPIIGPPIEKAAKPITETVGTVVSGLQLAADVVAANIPTPKNMKLDFPSPLDFLG